MKEQSSKLRWKALAFTVLTAVFMTAASLSVFALPEETEAAPSGDVVVRPEIEWTSSSEFSMDCLVTNESGMMIPETEIKLRLPEGSGLYFENDGRTDSFSIERDELKEEESFTFTLKGGRTEAEAEDNEALSERNGSGAEGTASGSENAGENSGENAADSDAEEVYIRMDIILRGYGLVHPTKAYLTIPPAPAPEVKKKPVFQYRIIAELKETGEDEENQTAVETAEYVRSFGFRTDETMLNAGKHKLHFPDLNGADRVKGRKLFAVLIGILVCILVTRTMRKGLEKKEVRILEQQRQFRRMKF